MKPAIVVIAILLIPVGAAAQVASSEAERPAPVDSPARGNPPTAVQLPPQQRPPDTSGARRRPSMVGYITDGVVGSQLRIRFDSGFRITDPDRAEFFYAKCGCYVRLPATNSNFDPDAPG